MLRELRLKRNFLIRLKLLKTFFFQIFLVEMVPLILFQF